MYQFTTTNVINSALDSAIKDGNGNDILKYKGANGVFNVARVGSFKKDNILSVYKNAYKASVLEQAQITVPAIDSGLVARLTVDVRLINSTNSEYASTYLFFKKPVTVEILATNNATNDAASLVTQLKGLKDRFGYSYITATSSGGVITVTATESHQRIKSMIVEKEVASPNSLVQPEYESVGTSFTISRAGVQGFGDDEWMQRAVVLPTAENVRYFGINKDGRPVLSGNYSQYILRYNIERDGDDGVMAGSRSITTHVFYVLADLVSGFEAAIIAAGKGIIATGTQQLFTLAAGSNVINITAISPFLLDNTEITATSSDATKATIGTKTVNAPTGDPLAQTASIALTKVGAGGAVEIKVVIDGVEKTQAITVA